REFALIMGGDNLPTLPKWKNAEILLRDYDIHVYNRPGYPAGELVDHPRVTFYDAPLMYLSATYIRQSIKDGHGVRYLVPEAVARELEVSGLYG
ncbi:MAG: nicotinic acid mononucleotide adenylyltransferase, partial [Bacteroidota bacterium]